MKPKSKNLVNGIVSFVLTICMLMSGGLATVGSYITEGISVYAANDFVWDLSDEGVLTITGTGEMPTYDWTKSSFTKSQVKTIVISEQNFKVCVTYHDGKALQKIINNIFSWHSHIFIFVV